MGGFGSTRSSSPICSRLDDARGGISGSVQEATAGVQPSGPCSEQHCHSGNPTITSMIRLARKPGTVGREVTQPRQLRLLSVREAADYAKVSTQTARRWIKAGYLKVYRAGRQIRIDESDLVHFLSSQ
jgi:excisionase family DNA binding protein